MESGISEQLNGWEPQTDVMTPEERRFWEAERYWKGRNGKRASRIKQYIKKHPDREPQKRYNKSYYERKKEKDTRPKLVCIFGPSGSGKTLASFMLRKAFGVHVICSYTTRPKRPFENDGVSHYFVNEVPSHDEMLAYTKFGGYEYWALKSDVKPPVTVYVIDEAGINDLLRFKDIYRIIVVRIDCRETIRYSRGISKERIERDKERVPLNVRPHMIVDNNRTPRMFKANLIKAYKRILKL